MPASGTRMTVFIPDDQYAEVAMCVRASGTTWADAIRQALRLWVARGTAAVAGREKRAAVAKAGQS